MKAYIVTIHIGFNFGSSLQTIATKDIVNRYYDKVEIINYHPRRVTYKGFLKRMFSSPKNFVKSLFSFPNYLVNRNIYYSYLSKYIPQTKVYYSQRELEMDLPQGDMYITGSDQVWNSIHNEGIDKIYYFSFLPDGTKRVAFSSSFGREELECDEYNEIKQYLKNYSAISVRESSAKLIIESMGFKVSHLLDPTLLLSKDDWQKYMSGIRIKEPYLLIYTPYNTVSKDIIYKTARILAKSKQLLVVTFSWTYLKDWDADQTIYYANPSDFLSLVNNADFVITNSFHGTAFSINLNKQFWVYDPSSFSTRIDSLIELTKLQNRKLKGIIDEKKMNEYIDYRSVNEILDKERGKASLFLDENLIDKSLCI